MKKHSLLLLLFVAIICRPPASAAGYCYELITPSGDDASSAYFSWNTEANGDITIWITGVPGNEETAFRGDGMAAGNFKVADKADITFGHDINAEKTKITLTPSASLSAGDVITFNATVEYKTSATVAPYNNLWPTIAFDFTYGETCNEIIPTPLATPTALVIGADNKLTFTTDANAGANIVTLYRETSSLPVYVQEDVTSGDIINYTESGDYSIRVRSISASLNYTNSNASDALPFTIAGEPNIPPAGISEYCGYTIGSGASAALITWETAANGDVIISLAGIDGDIETVFRGAGMNPENIKLNGYAGDWFDKSMNDEKTEITLTPKLTLFNGDKLDFNGTVEWQTTGEGNAYSNFSFTYTYGNTCAGAPSVSVSPMSIVFSPTEGIQSFTLSGENLTGEIKLQTPAGLSVSPASITPEADGSISETTVTVKWEDGNSSNGSIRITGGGLIAPKEVMFSSTGFSEYCNLLIFNTGVVNSYAYMTASMSDDMTKLECFIAPYYTSGTAVWSITNAQSFRAALVTVNGVTPAIEPVCVITPDLVTITFDQPLAEGDEVAFGGPMIWETDYSDEGFTPNNNCFIDAMKTYTVGKSCILNTGVLSVKSVSEASDITESSAKTTVTVTTGEYAVTQIKFTEDNGKIAARTLNKTGNNTYVLDGLTANTTYAFTVTAIDSEGNESAPYTSKLTFTTQSTTSIGEAGKVTLRLSPLPAKDVLTINGIGIPAAVTLTNMQGNVVLKAINCDTIDVSKLSVGMYLMRITDAQGNQYLEKVLVQ